MDINDLKDLTCAGPVPPYIPDADELAQLAEIEEKQRTCTHPDGIDPEDGCLHCGHYAK
jgi:hypothetical protein